MKKNELITMMERELSIIENYIYEKNNDILSGFRSYDELIDDAITVGVLDAQREILHQNLERVKRLEGVK